MADVTIKDAISGYLDEVRLARSKNTHDTYTFALQSFTEMLVSKGVHLESPAATTPEKAIAWFATHLKQQSPSTEQLYLHAAMGFYKYLEAERLADINLPRLQLLIQNRARRPGLRLPQFPAEDIGRLLDFVQDPAFDNATDEHVRLRALRDRAFLLTLADTGLRVHEACKLRRGDVDMNEGQALVIGKGDKQALIRFSTRSLKALKDYLAARASLDGSSGKPLASLPLYARHDKGAGKKVKPITTATGRNIVEERAAQALGASATGRITPHSLRHYFVTTVLRATGNLRIAQEMARHASIQVTQRYTHLSNEELDRAYHEIFDEHPSAE